MHRLIFVLSVIITAPATLGSYCSDWTLCARVLCQAPPDTCPAATPYLLWGECGCCQYCSAEPRIGPCGQCGVDVICREPEPICTGANQIVTLDAYCGCCKVCRTVVGYGGTCATDGSSANVCQAGLTCRHGRCRNY